MYHVSMHLLSVASRSFLYKSKKNETTISRSSESTKTTECMKINFSVYSNASAFQRQVHLAFSLVSLWDFERRRSGKIIWSYDRKKGKRWRKIWSKMENNWCKRTVCYLVKPTWKTSVNYIFLSKQAIHLFEHLCNWLMHSANLMEACRVPQGRILVLKITHWRVG